ncbi:aldose 1-epimerase [Paenibacillus pabuli]|uniref:aldose 1-epimerase n=1 Tax=Paenibacillus pabuli TaxID=1472 RepID=UPI00078560B3|nr:aldose 1-epimerase [Paenibacillus pabuli]MEC0125060.1 aldose 1-epimerase [Paenibacillus pabuli]
MNTRETSDSWEAEYQGEKAIYLRFGSSEAVMLPEIGGNLVAFRDYERGFHFLHEPSPDEMESFKARPMIHGIPVLFPPNRYEDGRFAWNGETLQLPVNEEATGNHLHGFLYNIPWVVDEYGHSGEESHVSVSITIDEDHPVYRHFPFSFSITLRYSLSSDGLMQHVRIRNHGTTCMPCLLAFHTSINAPFTANGSARDYRLKLTIGDRWELDERMLPTTHAQPLVPEEEQMRDSGVYPFFAEMDNHYTAVPQNGRNRMELQDTKSGMTLVYDVGTSYKQWMIWNNSAEEGFFCPEPQINLVNAPNLPLPLEKTGLFSIQPGEIWEETSRLYLRQTT